ncbi:MAG: thiamine pyrophosphate-dependent enzyme [Arenicellales bacterium]|jgi:thiamine pyrophosphate-dependent acetolactate synthase large subunit-like protein
MTNEHTLDRRKVVAKILAQRGDALLVTGLGSTCWDAAAAGDDARNFYVWGAMGGAAMIGLGLALARPERRVLVITGDGEMLMGLGSLATIAVQRPANLSIVVVDNEHYGETGMQSTHTRFGVDLAGMAAAAGFAYSSTVTSEEALQTLVPALYGNEGPTFAVVKVMARSYPTALPPRDGAYLKNRFREALLGAKAFA